MPKEVKQRSGIAVGINAGHVSNLKNLVAHHQHDTWPIIIVYVMS